MQPTTEIVLICRSRFSSCQRSSHESLPKSVNSLHLMVVLGGQKITDGITFRWNERFSFRRLQRDDRQQTFRSLVNDDLKVLNWRIRLYARSRNLLCHMRCCIHDQFLVKQPLSYQQQRCVKNCNHEARRTCSSTGPFVSPCSVLDSRSRVSC